jgi:hypothetical protein
MCSCILMALIDCGLTYARLRVLITLSVVAGSSAAGATTGASPSALESVTGLRLTATTRRAGVTRVRSSTTTSRVRGERRVRVLAFFAFFFFGITSLDRSKFMSCKELGSGVVLGTLQGDRVSRQGDVLHTLRAVCGTCYVNHATTVWTGKLLEQHKTCRDAARMSSLYKEVRHNF